MQLDIACHHFDLTDAIKQHAEEKLQKITHHFEQVINIKMILEIKKHEHIAEATAHSSGHDFFAKVSSDDMYASIDQMVNKLDAQIVKHKEKLKDHRS